MLVSFVREAGDTLMGHEGQKEGQRVLRRPEDGMPYVTKGGSDFSPAKAAQLRIHLKHSSAIAVDRRKNW